MIWSVSSSTASGTDAVIVTATHGGRDLRAEVRLFLGSPRMEVTFIDESTEATRATAHMLASFVWAQLVDGGTPRCEPTVCADGEGRTLLVVTGAGARGVVLRYFGAALRRELGLD